jgi:type IV pilus assembly protein PilV
MHQHPSLKAAQQGAVLLEALIAILLFSVGVLAIVGLQASMIKNVADSQYRSEAGYLAQARVAQMWADPAGVTAGNYVENNTDISAYLPGGTRTTTAPVAGALPPANCQYTVTVTWLQPGPGQTRHNATTVACIIGN